MRQADDLVARQRAGFIPAIPILRVGMSRSIGDGAVVVRKDRKSPARVIDFVGVRRA